MRFLRCNDRIYVKRRHQTKEFLKQFVPDCQIVNLERARFCHVPNLNKKLKRNLQLISSRNSSLESNIFENNVKSQLKMKLKMTMRQLDMFKRY